MLTCCCWENVALDGRAGVPADGGGLVHAKGKYTCTVGERGGQRAERVFMFTFFLFCYKI